MGKLTEKVPKPLLIVQNKPILEYSLLALRPSVDRVLVVVSYLSEQIEEYMAGQDIFTKYEIVHQIRPLGTGHAVASAKKHLKSDQFLVINGDDLYDAGSLHELAQKPLGILVVELNDPTKYAAVVTNKKGYVVRLHEKPPAGLYSPPVAVNIGAYKLNRSIFDMKLSLSERGEYEITEYITELAKKEKVSAVNAKFWLPIGTPEQLGEAQRVDLQYLTLLSDI